MKCVFFCFVSKFKSSQHQTRQNIIITVIVINFIIFLKTLYVVDSLLTTPTQVCVCVCVCVFSTKTKEQYTCIYNAVNDSLFAQYGFTGIVFETRHVYD